MKTLILFLSVLALAIGVQAATNQPAGTVTLEDFKLVGDLSDDAEVVSLPAGARVYTKGEEQLFIKNASYARY